ncbi:MAG: hypothetical protein AAF311_15655 [Pseudomonadota bacterium]
MTPKQISSKYRNRMIGSGFAYAGAVVGAAVLIDDGDPLTPLALVAAFAPGAALLLMLFFMWRFFTEIDEVGRFFMMQSLTAALFGTLAVCGVWGLAELFLDALPRLPVFYVFPMGMALFGIFSGCGFGWKAMIRDRRDA